MTSINDNIFEQATRKAIRFDTGQGKITTEDLWHLPLTSEKNACLDRIAKDVHKQLKEMEEESFVTPTANKGKATLELKFSVVKHIIDVKLAEKQKAEEETARKQQRERLLELAERKEQEELESQYTSEQLREMAKNT